MLEVILKQEVLNLGSKGDVVRVKDGYAQNYLFPKQLAMPATLANRQQIEQMRAAADREAARLRGDAEKLSALLQAVTITITAKAGDTDQLFGSVTSRDIAAELEKLGYTIDRHKIIIHSPIRTVGEHQVEVHVHRDIDVPIKVVVLAEGREQAVTGEEAMASSAETVASDAQEAEGAPADDEAAAGEERED